MGRESTITQWTSLGVLRLRPLVIALPLPAFLESCHLISYISIIHVNSILLEAFPGDLIFLAAAWDEDHSAKLRRSLPQQTAHLLTTHPPVLSLKIAVVHVGLFFCTENFS